MQFLHTRQEAFMALSAGYSSNTHYGIAAGYLAVPATGNADTIFYANFEACP